MLTLIFQSPASQASMFAHESQLRHVAFLMKNQLTFSLLVHIMIMLLWVAPYTLFQTDEADLLQMSFVLAGLSFVGLIQKPPHQLHMPVYSYTCDVVSTTQSACYVLSYVSPVRISFRVANEVSRCLCIHAGCQLHPGCSSVYRKSPCIIFWSCLTRF